MSASDQFERASASLRAGAFGDAEAVLRPLLQDDNPTTRVEALWYLVILRRDEGRLRDALALARQFAAAAAAENPPDAAPLPATVRMPEAQVLFEQDHFAEAAALWRDLARVDSAHARALPGEAARRRTWMLTHLATALAAAGGPAAAALPALADSVAAAGAGSAYGRDHVLHWYVRGLVAARARDWSTAERAFRDAMLSPTEGYTRVNLMLAQTLMAEGRPADAADVLRPALAGPVDASNYYVTRTALHEALARAFDAAGARDSAAVHWAWVAAAWHDADPPLRARARAARSQSRPER